MDDDDDRCEPDVPTPTASETTSTHEQLLVGGHLLCYQAQMALLPLPASTTMGDNNDDATTTTTTT
jgi:hypothetical protein